MTHASGMSRLARFRAAVNGWPVDRVPVSAWIHLGTEHLSAQESAWLHERWFRAYGWDVLKVMNDEHFDVPAHWLRLERPGQIRELAAAVTDTAPCFSKQQACLNALYQAVGEEVPLMDSGYSPWHMVLRHIGHDQADMLCAHPVETTHLLQTVCEAVCAHVQSLSALGVTAYFHATHGAVPQSQPKGISEDVFQRFVKPYDLAVLEAAKGLVRVLHVHGHGVELARLNGYPFEVLHLSDRAPTNPDLSQLRQWTGRCLMGGVDETGFTAASLGQLQSQLDNAVAQIGRQGLVLAPGCALPSSSSARSLRHLAAQVPLKAPNPPRRGPRVRIDHRQVKLVLPSGEVGDHIRCRARLRHRAPDEHIRARPTEQRIQPQPTFQRVDGRARVQQVGQAGDDGVTPADGGVAPALDDHITHVIDVIGVIPVTAVHRVRAGATVQGVCPTLSAKVVVAR